MRERGEIQRVLSRYGAIDEQRSEAWDDLELIQEVARAYSLAGNSGKVEQYFLRCAELNPKRAALYHIQIGWFYQRKKRWGRALTWYDRTLETFPTYHLCLFRKGYCLERLHRPRPAIAALEAAVASYDATTPEQQERSRGIQAQVLFHLARSRREIGDTARAREALDRCAGIDSRPEMVIKPEHRLASYGATYLRDGDAPAALGCLEEARARDPRSAVIWERLGLAHHLAGHIDEAENALLRACELPKGSVALLSLGRFYLTTGRLSDAAQSLIAALERHPQGEVQIRIELADLERRLGRPAAALVILERLASGRVPPQSTLAVTVETQIAEILLEHGHLAEGVAHLRLAREHDPEDPGCAQRLSEALAQLEQSSRGGAAREEIVNRPLPADLQAILGREPRRVAGVIASYLEARGFGFIAHGEKESTFFHVSQVEDAEPTQVRPGTRVTFVLSANPRNGKPQAESVRLAVAEGDHGSDPVSESGTLAAAAAAPRG
jgi:tetratricopeptide (TPR) repeat protein